jgi:hypothetical protein
MLTSALVSDEANLNINEAINLSLFLANNTCAVRKLGHVLDNIDL